jgi:hyperosmotically inducible protein
MKKLLILNVLGLAAVSLAAQTGSSKSEERIIRQVREELVTLPFYSLFDNLTYKVQDGKVVLMGQVVRPTLKTSAERVVKDIEGVQTVENQIEVLPVSPNDDRIRLAVYRAIYSKPGLDMYALRAVPTIHIIVKNGHVTLEGAVASEADKKRCRVGRQWSFRSLLCYQQSSSGSLLT